MAKDVVRSGVTFDKLIYNKLDSIVKNSKRFRLDKSEIINALINNSDYSIKQIQNLVMDLREKSSKETIRSGVTFDKDVFSKIDSFVKNSKRFRLDKSEIINALAKDSKLDLKFIQNLVMDYRETK